MTPMNPGPGYGTSPQPAVDAKAALNVPAILLLVVGALASLSTLLSLLTYLTGGGPMQALLNMIPDLPAEARTAMADSARGSPLNYAFLALSLVCNLVTIAGAWMMRQARSYGLSMASAIISMLPISCCCVFGLPIGIWAVVTMNKPEVRAQFT